MICELCRDEKMIAAVNKSLGKKGLGEFDTCPRCNGNGWYPGIIVGRKRKVKGTPKKHTDAERTAVYDDYKVGYTYSSLALMYGIPIGTISSIITRKNKENGKPGRVWKR